MRNQSNSKSIRKIAEALLNKGIPVELCKKTKTLKEECLRTVISSQH
ncbi:hypothetical protein [Heyndrickxia acidicola]|uniref:Uncharacterized protein n=1 Tax=Heyndrickxia acidicola TaxID=209389 RepID=A0ABU6MGE1_9BACI|nr:hypothetical protein [Heyndrickxia acidicola]MED1203742.1 hypothetical protein [Heyndrickxia acidicola]